MIVVKIVIQMTFNCDIKRVGYLAVLSLIGDYTCSVVVFDISSDSTGHNIYDLANDFKPEEAAKVELS